MNIVWTLATKDLKLLLRDKAGFFFTFAFPVVFACFFGLIFSDMSGGPSNVRVAILDQDGGAFADAFVAQLARNDMLSLRDAETLEAAEHAVRTGRVTALVVLPPDFTERSRALFTGDPIALTIKYDPARGMIAGMLQGLLMQASMAALADMLTSPELMRENVAAARDQLAQADDDVPGFDRLVLNSLFTAVDQLTQASFFEPAPATQSATTAGAASATDSSSSSDDPAWMPVKVASEPLAAFVGDDDPPSSYAVYFPAAIVWGVLACAATFGVSLVAERNHGTLPRLLLGPLRAAHVLAGKAVACGLTTCVVAGFMLVLAWLVFGVVPVAPLWLFISVPAVAVGVVGLMMLMANLGRTENAAGGFSWALIPIMCMFGGGMIPLFLMPSWMQAVSSLSFVKWAILAIEGPLWRGVTVEQFGLSCLILILVGFAGFVGGAAILQRRG